MLRRLLGERGEPHFSAQLTMRALVACQHRVAPSWKGVGGYLEMRRDELVFRHGRGWPNPNVTIPVADIIEVREKRVRFINAPILVVVTARETHEFVASVNLFGNISMAEMIALVQGLVARRDGGKGGPSPGEAAGPSGERA